MMPHSAESLQLTLALAEVTLMFVLPNDCPIGHVQLQLQLSVVLDCVCRPRTRLHLALPALTMPTYLRSCLKPGVPPFPLPPFPGLKAAKYAQEIPP